MKKMYEVLDEVVHTRASPGSDSWIGLAGFTDRGVEIARTFHAGVVGIPPPEIDDGQKAKGYVTFVSRLSYERMSDEEVRVRRLPRRLTLVQSIRALDRLQLTMADVIDLMKSVKGITAAQVPELDDAFEDSSACRELDAIGD